MLRALIDQSAINKAIHQGAACEILWILDQIDKSLRHQRNNALHAPLTVLTGVFDGALRNWAEANWNALNPRAKPLRGKDLIQEFQDYTEQSLPKRLVSLPLNFWAFFALFAVVVILHCLKDRCCHKLAK
jgi:hypothetical protein